MIPIELEPSPSIPLHSLEALQSDALLPICRACGTQYPLTSSLKRSCAICEDPRQFVPSSGQEWTTLAEMGEGGRKHIMLKDEEDSRISMISCEPAFAINQTPTLIETAEGSYIWDCSSFISLPLIGHLSKLDKPLKAIAISHPHFFSTSLTWSRALKVPLYLCEDDKDWYQRLGDIRPDDQVVWWIGEKEMGRGIMLVQCGGHFPGSSILYWDRLSEPPPPKDNLPTKPTPVSGIIFTADTIMVQPTQKSFSFIWSVPNMIPLRPQSILSIQDCLKHLSFAQATSSWPNRWIRQDAKKALEESVTTFLAAEGWRIDEGELVKLIT
ncbi:hydrolase [Kwoniella mangroviensis CBS 8886]|nr:hydrolase [Kwoniella mangroviensis CBS 8886]